MIGNPCSTERFSLVWAIRLVEGLQDQGVCHFCIAPGARSFALTYAVHYLKAPYTVHMDERALGFHALGIALARQKAVAIIVTSGTALGELYPAVMEAYHSKIPIIILSGDRPPEYINSGAPQTCDQIHFFGHYVIWEAHLPLPSPHINPGYLSNIALKAVHFATPHAQDLGGGPVHINIPLHRLFEEENDLEELLKSYPPKKITQNSAKARCSDIDIDNFAELIGGKKGLLLLGGGLNSSAIDAALTLGKQLKWPIIADILSGARGSSQALPFYSLLIQQEKMPSQKVAIIHYGQAMTSKTINHYLKKITPFPYLHATAHVGQEEPNYLASHRTIGPIETICQELGKRLRPLDSAYQETLYQLGKSSQDTFNNLMEQMPLCDLSWIAVLRKNRNPRPVSYFFSNSMTIHDAEQFLFPEHGTPWKPFSNRGLSGIDGILATSAGIALGSGQPTIAVLGDLAFLHDLNSLSLVAKSSIPILILLINNNAGAIFSYFPIMKNAPAPFYKEIVLTHHPYNAEYGARMFNLPYKAVTSVDDLKTIIDGFTRAPKTQCVEISTTVAQREALLVRLTQAALISPTRPHIS